MTQNSAGSVARLLDHASPIRLGTPDAPLRFSNRGIRGGRGLLIDDAEAFELTFPCSTCALLFRRLDEGARALAEEALHGHLDDAVPAVDDPSLLDLVSGMLPEGEYLPLLLSTRPVLVAPGDDQDYFTGEQVAHRGIDPNVGAPEDPATAYYRGATHRSGEHEFLFEFLVPMVPPGSNERERVSDYEASLRTGAAATVLAVSVLDRTQPCNSDHVHTGLVHFVLDGHHKLEAAAHLGVPITVLSFVSIDASLADTATVARLPEVLAG